ncbi:hypothetical protein ABZ023_02845 [Streptomyces sp. NPDC006367]|uniref:hypothetical protein n=1 Tax=unclassified Streptomyces TaxID=2593676 RepID=UPI0033B2A1FA
MIGSRPLRVPVGHDAERWSTFHGERTLVVAARTVTSTARVLECLPALVRGDRRVTVVFAHDPTSAFDDGVLDLLHDAGCRVMPWQQLDSVSPDLILTASENIDVPEDDCPVLVLPHGVGFHKHVPDSRSPRHRLSGVVPDSLLEAGRAWLAVSHPAQEEQLLHTHPKAAGHTLLVGDPSFDELRAGLRRAASYRSALGVADGRQLVVVSSTWGSTSLLGRVPDLTERLLAELPYDEYRVAAIVHPNVWAAHGAWQIRTLQASALDAGLLLVPPVHAWRPVLAAASVVVGDHGSVTLYGAALGKPVLLAAFGSDAVPDTAVAALGRTAPRLDLRGGLRGQIEDAVRTHAADRYADIRDQAFAEPGHALARLRTELYRLMRLPEPPTAPPRAVPPRPFAARPQQVTSWLVVTSLEPGASPVRPPAPADTAAPVVSLCRFPAAVRRDTDEAPGTFVHLASDEEEPDAGLLESASVLVRRTPMPTTASARDWIRDTLARLPGSLLAAVALRGGGSLVGLRDGRTVLATGAGCVTDPGLLAAAVHTVLRAELPPAGAFTVRLGGLGEATVLLRPHPHRLTAG